MLKENKLSMFRSADECFACGKKEPQVEIGFDHYFLQVVERRPRALPVVQNPFREVVHSPLNVFRLCVKCHDGIDEGKILAYEQCKGPDFVDPVSLVKFLGAEYPITSNPQYRMLQIGSIIEINRRFARVALSLNGELPRWMRYRYQQAAGIALGTAERLALLVDLERIKLLKYQY